MNVKVPEAQSKNRTQTRRQAQCAEYAITQQAWKRNPNNCLKFILKDKSSMATPDNDTMIRFWQTTMTWRSDECITSKNAITPQLQIVIQPEEIRDAFPDQIIWHQPRPRQSYVKTTTDSSTPHIGKDF